MAIITFISDSHGRWAELQKRVRKINDTISPDLIIQLGDIGMGFRSKDSKRRFASNFRFLRGNHDSPQVCQAHPSYLGDYGYIKEYKLFFMGGADSIDKNHRIEGYSWWRDEQLSQEELQNAIDLCVQMRPEIIVTHDAPKFLYNRLTEGSFAANGSYANRTCNALEVLFELWRPKYHIFGHHHQNMTFNVKGTEFRCLEPMGVFSLNIR